MKAKSALKEHSLCPKCDLPFPNNGAMRHTKACTKTPLSEVSLASQLAPRARAAKKPKVSRAINLPEDLA